MCLDVHRGQPPVLRLENREDWTRMQGLGGQEACDSEHFGGHRYEEGPYAEGVPRSWGHLSMTGCQPGVASELMKWVAVVVRIQAPACA